MKALIIALWLVATSIAASLSWIVVDMPLVLPAKFCLIMTVLFAEILFSILFGLFWRDL